MIVKASGRSALILAAGLLVCFAGPSQAAAGADGPAASSKSESAAGSSAALNKNVKHNSRRWKSYAHRKSSKVALKSSTEKKAAAPVAADDGANPPAIPPSVANANAQLASADTPTGNAKAMSARANDILRAIPGNQADAQATTGAQVVAADQLNDVDRALHQGDSPAPTLTLASAETPVAPAAPILTSSNENSTWDQTSLIGKIFIGFGALLTMASAARMFMA
jgi:hypothetical protein